MFRFGLVFGLLSLVSSQAAHATVLFTFDPTGSGGAGNVQAAVFDFAPGNALADNALLGAPALLPGTTFNLFFQAKLNTVQDSTNTAVALGNNITLVAGFTEVVTGTNVVGGALGSVTSSFGLASNATVNFLKMYHGGAVADDLNGTGFDDGTLILDAVISANSGSFSVEAPNGVANQNTFDGYLGDNYSGLQSVVGGGGVQLTANVLSYNSNYFTGGLPASALLITLFNSSNITPFNQANPSRTFSSTGTTGGTGNLAPNLGSVNGLGGGTAGPHDFQFQADANASFSIIPEPASLLVFGLLGGCGFIGRRRMR